jgi:hypothetical protein
MSDPFKSLKEAASGLLLRLPVFSLFVGSACFCTQLRQTDIRLMGIRFLPFL